MDELIDHWLSRNPHVCAWLAVFVGHLYLQSYWQRRVLGMRRGDGFWLMPPRLAPGEVRPWWKWVLYLFWHPHRPKPMRRRNSRPPDSDATPKV